MMIFFFLIESGRKHRGFYTPNKFYFFDNFNFFIIITCTSYILDSGRTDEEFVLSFNNFSIRNIASITDFKWLRRGGRKFRLVGVMRECICLIFLVVLLIIGKTENTYEIEFSDIFDIVFCLP